MKDKLVSKIIVMVLAVVTLGITGLTIQYYTSESYLTLKGDEKVTIGLNGLYDDPGVDAVLHGRDASDEVTVSGKIDTETPGVYTREYRVGNFVAQREVEVLDVMDPVIELKGGDTTTIKLAEEFEEPGYLATDSKGNDLTDKVKVTNREITRAGKHRIAYSVVDSEGKGTRVYRDVKVLPNTEYKTSGLPICMYHNVYDENNIPSNVNANWISKEDLAEELQWLNEHEYYFPTWQEVRDYVDGKLILPEKSIVLTFDDGRENFFKNGIPVLEQYEVPATCFVITSKDGEKKVRKNQSEYITYESHSDNLHRGGGNIGHGGIMTVINHDEGVADLKKSIEIVGRNDAFAYPFGDTNENTKQIVQDAGFKCAVTTNQGRVKPGDDPYLLNRQRMSRNQSMDSFRAMVIPF